MRLGELPLRQIRASSNRIERLWDDTFRPVTAETLEFIGLASNNILELPTALAEARNLKTVRVEYNPMRNPPAKMLSEGSEVLVHYCRLRDERISKFVKVLREFRFDCYPPHLAPEAYDVLVQGKQTTGFLTPDDMANFDTQVDTYLNGAYYTCAATDLELMERIDRLRGERQHTFYHGLLQGLIDVLFDEVASNENATKRRFGCGVLLADDREVRPWGRKGELVQVYCLSLGALVKAHPARGIFVKHARPAIFDLVKERMPESIFEYTLEILKDAVHKYESAYGPVAALDKVQFDRCECVDDKGRSKNHRPCILPSIVVCQTIVSTGEAQRRVFEDDAIEAAWFDCWKTIDDRLLRKQGRLQQSTELDRRKRDSRVATEALAKETRRAQKALAKALEKLDIANRRRQNFIDSEDFALHHLKSADEAAQLVAEATAVFEGRLADHKAALKDLAMIKQRAKLPFKVQLSQTTLEIKKKYCVLAYEAILDEERRKACVNDWRRPWDGPEGAYFKAWLCQYAIPITAGNEALRTVPKFVRTLQHSTTAPPRDDDEDDEEEAGTAAAAAARLAREAFAEFPYTWEGCDTMKQFENDRYDRWESTAMAQGFGDEVQNTLNREKFEAKLQEEGKV